MIQRKLKYTHYGDWKMIKIKKLEDITGKELHGLFNRFGEDFSSIITGTVMPIVKGVREGGDRAVLDYTEKFDGVRLNCTTASEEEIERGWRDTPGDVLKAFLSAGENIHEFHSRQKRDNISYTRSDGITLGIMYQPIENAAIYVPGGKASYPSSALMGIIPAQIAGCKNITIITPPDRDGNISNVLLAICRELNIHRIIKAGGAQGIAAAALGTETIARSEIIVGPGNVYVTAAKTYLFSLGIIQIDSMAGPSEVLIIADEKSDPKWIAYDLLSQAEHEENATAILLTPSESLAGRVAEEIEKDLDSGSGRHEIKRKSIEGRGMIILTGTMDKAISFSNSYAPEHMELMVDNPLDYLDKIKNAGSLFLGRYAPVSIGDYYSGTNHILPTGGAARFSSGTSVETFLRRMTFQLPSKDFLRKSKGPVGTMSGIEGFDDKHGGSIDVRFEDENR